MYSKRKLFIFHSEKAVSQIEAQPNQSKFIEDLVLNYNPKPDYSDIINLLKQYISPTPQSNISNSISNVLQEMA